MHSLKIQVRLITAV